MIYTIDNTAYPQPLSLVTTVGLSYTPTISHTYNGQKPGMTVAYSRVMVSKTNRAETEYLAGFTRNILLFMGDNGYPSVYGKDGRKYPLRLLGKTWCSY